MFTTLNEYKEKDDELVVCGGATIYKLALPYVDKLVISEIKNEYVGDAYFPDFEDKFDLISSEDKGEFVVKTYLSKKV